jgi:hypothetical protein
MSDPLAPGYKPPPGANENFTTRVVGRSPGQNILDTIRAHAGSGVCPACGNEDFGDGHVALAPLYFLGERIEAIVSVEHTDPDSMDSPIVTTPLAIILNPELAREVSASPEPSAVERARGDERTDDA